MSPRGSRYRDRVRRHVLRRGHGERDPASGRHKLKAIAGEEGLTREMILEGILSIQAGDNPRIVREKLQSYLPLHERSSGEDEEAGGGRDRAAA
jgi:hypothetical protein